MKSFLTNIQLTCEELSSLLEVGENKVTHHIEACKEENADLHKKKQKQKTIEISTSNMLERVKIQVCEEQVVNNLCCQLMNNPSIESD